MVMPVVKTDLSIVNGEVILAKEALIKIWKIETLRGFEKGKFMFLKIISIEKHFEKGKTNSLLKLFKIE
jgi:hypothetical protein